ncbi:MAG: hypothetical protein Q9227_005450, partial [Pyrenula ochraceoflavens]
MDSPPGNDGQNGLYTVESGSSGPSIGDKVSRPTARSNSHSLLSSSVPSSQKRRAGQASVESTAAVVDRASISMPPPTSKPSTDRRGSTSGWRQKNIEDSLTSP